jgi:hypothetical protein
VLLDAAEGARVGGVGFHLSQQTHQMWRQASPSCGTWVRSPENSAIPSAYPRVDAFDFRTETRQALFRYAYGCAQAGRLWTQFRRTEQDSGSVLSSAGAPTVPCPANDASNFGYFVSR